MTKEEIKQRVLQEGKPIYESIQKCDCGLTGGCNLCRPSFIGSITDKEADEMKRKWEDWKKRFNEDFERRKKELEDFFTP